MLLPYIYDGPDIRIPIILSLYQSPRIASIDSLLQSNKFSSKNWGLNCSLLLQQPHNRCQIQEDEITSLQLSCTLVPSMIRVNEQLKVYLFTSRFYHVTIKTLPIMFHKVGKFILRIGWIKHHPRIMLVLQISIHMEHCILSRCPSWGNGKCKANSETSIMKSTWPSSTIQCKIPICNW